MPQRIQLRRTKGWRLPANTVVVARPTKWGNPFAIGKTVIDGAYAKIDTAEDSVAHFRAMLALPERNYPGDLAPLQGKNLACWCAPGAPCHGDVLLELANAAQDPA